MDDTGEHTAEHTTPTTACIAVVYTRPARMTPARKAEIFALAAHLRSNGVGYTGIDHPLDPQRVATAYLRACAGTLEDTDISTMLIGPAIAGQYRYCARILGDAAQGEYATRRVREIVATAPPVEGLTVSVKPTGAAIGAELVAIVRASIARGESIEPYRAALEALLASTQARLDAAREYRAAYDNTLVGPLADLRDMVATAPQQLRQFVNILVE